MLPRIAPGVALSVLVAVLASVVGAVEARFVGRAVVEPLVVAIILGMIARSAFGEWKPSRPGVRVMAKQVLELAVLLLGATMDVPQLFASGPLLAVGIVALVCVALSAGYGIGRMAGLSPKLSILVASGNAICGNSAIAAVAPVIGADQEDIAASIALTAVFGVIVVLTLPLVIPLAGLSHHQYGVLAGLTVYSVPQVLAAAFAVSAVSGQVATVVKLARVLMLGPVVTFFAVRERRASATGLSLTTIVPWFVMGFVVLAALRSAGLVGDSLANVAKVSAAWLTVGSMAALGLTVDLRSIRAVGPRVVVAVALSLVVLLFLALGLIAALGAKG